LVNALDLTEAFLEIQAASNTKSDLVTNIQGTKLYAASKGWGRLWRLFYRFICIALGEQYRIRKVQKVLRRCSAAYQRMLPSIEQAHCRYQELLCSAIEGRNYDRNAYKQNCRTICEWYHHVRPLVKQLYTHSSAMQTLLRRYDTGFKESFLSSTLPRLKTAKRCKKIIDLERLSEKLTPYDSLRECAFNRAINGRDEKLHLRRWFHAVESKLTVGLFHKALKHLVKHLKRFHVSEASGQPSLQQLEVALSQLGCKLFQQRDETHHEWRTSLKPGDSIQCNNRLLILGERLGTKRGSDTNYVFRIANDTGYIAHISQNCALPGMKALIAEKYSWAVPPATWQSVDTKGRLALVEYLPQPVHNLQRPDPLIALTRWLIRKNQTPTNFNLKFLKYSQERELKSTKIHLVGPFNFNAIENVIRDYCLGNKPLYQQMMRESGMSDHSYAPFFREVLHTTLSGDNIDPADLAAFSRYQITDPHCVDSAKQLKQDILQIQSRCLEACMQSTLSVELNTVIEQITHIIRDEFNATGALSAVPSGIESRIMHACRHQ